jgi:hypothetical protein
MLCNVIAGHLQPAAHDTALQQSIAHMRIEKIPLAHIPPNLLGGEMRCLFAFASPLMAGHQLHH